MENKILNSQVPNQDNFLINPELQKKRQQRKIVYLVMAIILVIGSALGSYFLSKNLNRADVPNAPSSQPQAAGKKQVTNNTIAERCTQGCASDEYCDNTRCRKIGGNADGRNDAQKAWDSIVVATPTLKGEGGSSSGTGYEAIPGYVCTDANCNSGFHCLNGNTCVNDKNANLSVANDPENCGGTASKGIGKVCKVNEACVGGKCVTSGNTCNTSGEFVNCDGARSHCVLDSSNVKRCVPLGESTNYANSLVPIVYVTPIVPTGDKKNCGGNVCSPTQVCIANECTSEGVTGTDNCMYKNPYNGDGGGSIRECCVQNIGVIPVGLKNGELYNNEIIVSDTNRGTTDTTWHWTHCAPGTSCQQGVGCIGSGTKTPEKTTTEITTVTTVTTTVTATPSITVTTTPTATPTATITVTVTSTPSGTVTTTPTPATCNESCGANSDCASGLFCDSNSNKCRKAECSTESSCVCPTATPEPTIVGCNKRCNEDSNCMEGLICDTGSSNRCRRPSCMSAYDCRCQKISTPTTPPTEQITNTRRVAKQPERLVESGVLDLPGVVTFGGGLILTIVGILLAL